MIRSFVPLRAILMASSSAMLAACSTSQGSRPPELAPDPIIEQHTVTRTVCPLEITEQLPAKPAPPARPAMKAAPDTLKWVGAHFAREDALEERIVDAKSQCPKAN